MTFRKYLDTGTDAIFHAMMLTVRQICSQNETILGSYTAWYKATIGEMKYTLKTDEFNAVMRTLTNMLGFENDPDILNVHINTAVPAPTFCNDIVLNYKQLCRGKLFECTAKKGEKAAGDDITDDSQAMDVYIIE